MVENIQIYHFVDIKNPYTSTFLSDEDMLILLKNQVISGQITYHSVTLRSRNNLTITFHEAIDYKIDTELDVDVKYLNYITQVYNIKSNPGCSGPLKLTYLKLFSDLVKPLNDLKTLENILFKQMDLQSARIGRDNQVFRPEILTSVYQNKPIQNEEDCDRYISVGLVIKDDKVLMIGRGKNKPGYVFPKGGCEDDEWPFSGLTVLRETYEEAGCICEIVEEDVTRDYVLDTKGHKFFVYKLKVIEYLDDYPEGNKRNNKRKWMTFDEALNSLCNMNLKAGKLKLFVSILEYGFGKFGESRVSRGNFQKNIPAERKKKKNITTTKRPKLKKQEKKLKHQQEHKLTTQNTYWDNI